MEYKVKNKLVGYEEFEQWLIIKEEKDWYVNYEFKFDNGCCVKITKNIYSKGNQYDLFELTLEKVFDNKRRIMVRDAGWLTNDTVLLLLKEIKEYDNDNIKFRGPNFKEWLENEQKIIR